MKMVLTTTMMLTSIVNVRCVCVLVRNSQKYASWSHPSFSDRPHHHGHQCHDPWSILIYSWSWFYEWNGRGQLSDSCTSPPGHSLRNLPISGDDDFWWFSSVWYYQGLGNLPICHDGHFWMFSSRFIFLNSKCDASNSMSTRSSENKCSLAVKREGGAGHCTDVEATIILFFFIKKKCSSFYNRTTFCILYNASRF